MKVYVVTQMLDIIHGVFSTEEKAMECFTRRKLSEEDSSICEMTVDEPASSEYLQPGTPE